jgi:phosphoglycerol transferase MdoB-like AlkP superfamily enzyme
MKYINRIKIIFQEVLTYYVIFISIFQIYRIALYHTYTNLFNDLDFFALITILILGCRFDFSSTSVLLFIPIILLISPIPLTGHWIYRRFIASIIYIELAGLIVFLNSDYLYFNNVKRHITNELFFILKDLDYLISEISSNLFIFIIILFIILFSYRFYLNYLVSDKKNRQRSITGFILIVLLMILLGRGGFQLKPITVIDAYQYGSTNQGHLILNGFFTASHYSISTNFIVRDLKEEASYIETLELFSSNNSEFPLVKKHVESKHITFRNAVVIIVESLTPKYIDSLSGNNYGVTPNLDMLVNKGLVYNNFFANGQRSIEGAQAILTGIPPLPGIPDITVLPVNYSRLGNIAKANGYRTIYVTTTLRESFSLDLMVYAAGIEEYYGQENYPILLNYIDDPERYLGWDYEAFMHLLNKLDDENKPYLAIVNPSSDHSPFVRMHEPFTRYEHGTNSEGGYLNMLHYTDWALGEFITKFSKRKDFHETVFIITGDHAFAHFQEGDPYNKFRIPLIVYSPGNIKPSKSNLFASQIDLMPSLINLLDLKGNYSSIGKNIFDSEKGYAIVKEGSLVNFFNSKGYLQHSLNRILDYKLLDNIHDESTLRDMEMLLTSYDHLTYLLLSNNRWKSQNVKN